MVQDIHIRYRADTSGLSSVSKTLDKVADKEEEIADGFRRINKESASTASSIKSNFSGIEGVAKAAGAAVVASLTFDALVSAGEKIIDVTSKFQKFEAVLTNQLGSNSAAKRALYEIQEFAAKTPFSVDQITDSFIKLQGAGINPTTANLTKLGDLASSKAKSLDQLTEAIIDAQVGEFERLKEFQIRASKAGDQVSFTFNGQTKVIKNTEAAIQEYILSLGEAQGVSGSMAAIAGTLEGQMSNLGDSTDDLALAFGEVLGPSIANVVGLLSELSKGAATALRGTAALIESEELTVFDKVSSLLSAAFGNVAGAVTITTELAVKKVKEMGDAAAEAATQAAAAAQAPVGLLKSLEEELKRLQTAQKEAFTAEAVKSYQVEIERVKKQIQELTTLSGPLRSKGIFGDFSQVESGVKVARDAQESLFSDFDQNVVDARVRLEEFARSYAQSLAFPTNLLDDPYEQEAARQERILQLRESALETSIGFVNAYFEYSATMREKDLADLEAKRNNELQLVGDNEQAKSFIQDKFRKQEAAIRTKQAQAEKAQAMFNIAVSTAAAIVKQLAATPLPVGAPFVAFIAAQGAIQLALTASRPIPKFRKGTDYLQQPGAPKGTDKILMWGDEGERIFSKEDNKQIGKISNKEAVRLINLGKEHVNYQKITKRITELSEKWDMQDLLKRVEVVEQSLQKPASERLNSISGRVAYPANKDVFAHHTLSEKLHRETLLPKHVHVSTGTSKESPTAKLEEEFKLLRKEFTTLAGKIERMPIHQIQMDEKGFEKFIRTPNYTAKILHNQFP